MAALRRDAAGPRDGSARLRAACAACGVIAVRRLALLALIGCGGSGDEVCAIDGKLCGHLSSWQLFDDIATQTPAPGVYPYDLTTPLFSDYTTKDRFVR